ncbi:MAG TPA: TetR/AcrR family transcriptional regulator [Streptosporangiaceae bacterium]|nr:TetR/AcrR family transcriptional regulator [Streptosporangiaceae bacterium]
MTSRAEQGRATRDQLIEVATGLFAEHGYEDTSIEAVLAAAGVSRGALYHHFAGKDALFQAVVDTLEARVLAELAEVTKDAPDAVATLHTGAMAWIDLAGDPVIQRILLIDAPAVVGWEQRRAEGENNALNIMRMILHAVAQEGHLPDEFADPFAHMVLAAVDEAALMIARADDTAAAQARGRAAVAELLRRITTP